MRLENYTVVFSLAFAILCNCFISSQSTPYGATYYHGTPQYDRHALYGSTDPSQAQHLIRPQRSIYGGGWASGGGGGGGGGGVAVESVGLSHITKEELIALLEAWKEVEAGAGPEPEIEAEPEPAKRPEPEAPKLPPPGVPLTVSLPAFVPIQLQAMYTAPAPAPAAAPAAGGGGAGGAGGGIVEASGPEDEEGPETAIAQGPVKDIHQTIFKIWAPQTARQAAPIVLSGGGPKKGAGRGKGPGIKLSKVRVHKTKQRSKFYKKYPLPIQFPVLNPRNFASNNFVAYTPRNLGAALYHGGSAPRIYSAPPPPPYLSHAPGPLKLVPSTQLLSNWH